MQCSARQRYLGRWKRVDQRGPDVPAQSVTRKTGIQITFIFNPGQGMRFGIRQHVSLQHVEQRSQIALYTLRHGGQPGRTGTAQELQQKRFRLITGMMCEQHRVSIHTIKRLISRRTRGRLDAYFCRAVNLDALYGNGNSERCAYRLAMGRPGIGIRAQTMMYMVCSQRPVPVGAFARSGDRVQ